MSQDFSLTEQCIMQWEWQETKCVKEWYNVVHDEVTYQYLMPLLPEIADKVARWRRTWKRIKEREYRAHIRRTSGLIGKSSRLVG